MQRTTTLLALSLLLAAPATGGGIEPASVLVHPVYESSPYFGSILSVTNTNEDASSPGITVRLDVVNAREKKGGTVCTRSDRYYDLGPADTRSLVIDCEFPNHRRGYAVATAVAKGTSDPVAHDYLIGSLLVFSKQGSVYSVPAVPFTSPLAEGTKTDADADGRLDFDGIEYEQAPDRLYVDSFLIGTDTKLTLISLPSDLDTVAYFLAYNDDGWAFSATYLVDCFASERIEEYIPFFDPKFYAYNTPNDPNELDLDCDGDDDVETAWFRVEGLRAHDGSLEIDDPVLLGVLTQEQDLAGMARPLWWKGRRSGGEH